MSLRILFISHRIPAPLNQGDKLRSYLSAAHASSRSRFTQVVGVHREWKFPATLEMAVGTRLIDIQEVHVAGFINDVRAYLLSVGFCLISLRIFIVVRNWLLKVMGKVVCSFRALAGIMVEHGKEPIDAENVQALTGEVKAILQVPALQNQFGHPVRLLKTRRYARSEVLQGLNQLLPGMEGWI